MTATVRQDGMITLPLTPEDGGANPLERGVIATEQVTAYTDDNDNMTPIQATLVEDKQAKKKCVFRNLIKTKKDTEFNHYRGFTEENKVQKLMQSVFLFLN